MDEHELFKAHVAHCVADARAALDACGYDTLMIHAGTPVMYHADDQEVTFRSLPHFRRFVPLQSPHHMLIITRTDVRVLEILPEDYWEERGGEDEFWKREYHCITLATEEEAWQLIGHLSPQVAFIGDEPATADIASRGLPAASRNPAALRALLDTSRAHKTPYEIHCIDAANKHSAPAHTAARDLFLSGASELEIHTAFVAASGQEDCTLPYRSIVALNEKGSTLHYMRKRADVRAGMTFLIDAAASYRGYAADVSRTYATAAAPKLFTALLSALDTLQQSLVSKVRPGVAFIELHHEAHLGIARILNEHGVLTVDGEEAVRSGITRTFLPHGLGHLLGLQVHDVGNSTDEGKNHPLRELYPHLRTNLKLEAGMVTTIEPGIYFNDILLGRLKTTPAAAHCNWDAVETLRPCGGIRIEDNIVVTAEGHTNLTRQYLP